MADEHHNGNNGAAPAPGTARLVLDYDLLTGKLEISGAIPSIDIARHMLAQAAWEYESQWRHQRAHAFAQELAEGRKLQALSESIMGRRH